MDREPLDWSEVGLPPSARVSVEEQAAKRFKTISAFVRDTLVDLKLRADKIEQEKAA